MAVLIFLIFTFCLFYIFGVFYLIGRFDPKIRDINKDNFIAHSGKISMVGLILFIVTVIIIKL